MSKKHVAKDVISYVFAFFIAISLAVLCLSILLSRGLFSKEVFLSAFSDSSFYEKKIEQVDKNLADRLETAGLPAECAEDVFIPGAVTVDINNDVRDILDGKKAGMSSNYHKPGTILRTNIMKYLKSKGINNSSEIRKAVDLIVEETEKDYQTQISFGFLNKFSDYFNKYSSVLLITKIVSIIVLIISSLAVIFLRSRLYRGIRLVECGLFAGTVLTYFVSYSIRHSIVQYIPKDDGPYRELISSFISKSFSHEKYIIMIGLLLVILLNIINRYFKKQVI